MGCKSFLIFYYNFLFFVFSYHHCIGAWIVCLHACWQLLTDLLVSVIAIVLDLVSFHVISSWWMFLHDDFTLQDFIFISTSSLYPIQELVALHFASFIKSFNYFRSSQVNPSPILSTADTSYKIFSKFCFIWNFERIDHLKFENEFGNIIIPMR